VAGKDLQSDRGSGTRGEGRGWKTSNRRQRSFPLWVGVGLAARQRRLIDEKRGVSAGNERTIYGIVRGGKQPRKGKGCFNIERKDGWKTNLKK